MKQERSSDEWSNNVHFGTRYYAPVILTALLLSFILVCSGCTEENPTTATVTPQAVRYTISQSISDEAQKNTISFDALAFLTGSVGSQSFLPPGKVADYSGFQYLRDNDPTNLGHNTDFVTIIAFNVLNILNSSQINMYVAAAQKQIDDINDFAYMRFPLLQAFRRLKESDFPAGTSVLDNQAVEQFTASLYNLDGKISYERAKLFGEVIASLSADQRIKLDALKNLNGAGNWNRTLQDPLRDLHLNKDINVAVMTYASEMYSWYAGSVISDVYFCPERHGTYFGSFYLKDWPAMGNPNYTINEQLTASAGKDFLSVLSADQSAKIDLLLNNQRAALNEMVQTREQISSELRKFMNGSQPDSLLIISLSEKYGELDGRISYLYATVFTEIFNTLTTGQKDRLSSLVQNLGYQQPAGAFLYSQPITMPVINSGFQFFR